MNAKTTKILRTETIKNKEITRDNEIIIDKEVLIIEKDEKEIIIEREILTEQRMSREIIQNIDKSIETLKNRMTAILKETNKNSKEMSKDKREGLLGDKKDNSTKNN